MPHEQEKPAEPTSSEHEQQDVQTENERAGTLTNEKDTQNTKKRRWWNLWKKWEGEEADWWFASTGIPLLAATLGPLANVSSIAALVTPWRQRNIINGEVLTDFQGVPFGDPRW